MNMILDRKAGWAFLLSALMATACGLGQSKGEPDSSSTKGGAARGASAFAPSNDPRKDFRDALEKLNTAYPYRLTEIMFGSVNGKEIPQGTRVVEFAAADRSHTKWTNGPLGDWEAI